MSNPVTNDAQTRLLFKQFMGVASTELDRAFDQESFNFVPNIFSKDVMIEEVPAFPPYSTLILDASGDWQDSFSDYATNTVDECIYTPTGQTFSEMFPDTNLKFYKRLSLVPVTSGSNGRVWGSFTDYTPPFKFNKESVLEHAIPFKFDDVGGGYLPVVYRNNAATGAYVNFPLNINSSPTYWLMDAGSGYLLFYASETDLISDNIAADDLPSGVQDPLKAPKISCFVYNGKLGITNLDVSGQVQVGDLSGVLASMPGVDRMLLPDGSANIFDLCGNDAIRSQYKYVRKNLFVGYSDMPFGLGTTPLPVIIADDVSHNFDPSHIDASGDTITYEFDVSGRAHFSGPIVQNGDSGSSAFGLYSASFGTDTKARKQGCFSQGNTTDASGQYSHAEGQITLADGAHSHSEGSHTKSYGIGSHAEGISGESWGSYSHASGQYTIIGTDYGTSIGKFNDTSKNVLFVIGDGTSDSARSDAFSVNTSGDTLVNNDLDVYGTVDISQTLQVLGGSTFNGVTNTGLLENFGNISNSANITNNGNITTQTLNVADTINNNNTILLTKSFIPATFQNQPAPNGITYYEVAFTPNNKFVNNISAYFTFSSNQMRSDDEAMPFSQRTHFLAGITFDTSDANSPGGQTLKPYIKVIADNATFNKIRLKEIHIVRDDGGIGAPINFPPSAPNPAVTEYVYLILGFIQPANFLEETDLRMYKNAKGEQIMPAKGRDWLMGNQQQGISVKIFSGKPSIYDGNSLPGAWTRLSFVDMDMGPSAYSTLNEYFLGNVEISGNFLACDASFCDVSINNLTVTGTSNLIGIVNPNNDLNIAGNVKVNNRTGNPTARVDISGSLDVQARADFRSAVYAYGNILCQDGYRGFDPTNSGNIGLILDASHNTNCFFELRHKRGKISIGKEAQQTGISMESIDGIHFLTDPAAMNPISVREKVLDLRDNRLIGDFINVRDGSFNDISTNNIYSHGSLLLDYSSVEITTPASVSTNYYDIAFVGTDVFNLNNVPIFQCKSASAMFEIYIVKKIDGLTQSNSFNNIFSYVKFQASVFRQQAASIEILNGFNINAAQAYIKSLRIKYRSGTNFVFDDPGGLLQIGLARGLGIGAGTAISMYCRISQNNFEQKQQAAAPSAFQYLNSTWKMSLSNSINNSPTYDTFQSGGAALPNQSFSKTREVLCDFNPNIGTTASTAPFGDGLMFSINDKDTKFTSNCRFDEDVDFSGNISVTGLINAFGNINMNGTNITNASNLTVRGNGSFGTYRTKVDWLDVSRNIVVRGSPLDNAAGPVFEARGVPDSSENTIVMRGWLNSSNSNQESIVATVGRNNVGSGFNWFYINPNQSDRIRLTVGTPNAGGTEGGFSVGTSNNIKCNVGLSLYKDTKTNLDSGSKSLDVGAIGIMEDVGINVTTTGQKRADALFWKASIANSTSNPRLIINEMKSRIYNNRLCSGYTNNSNYRGGIDDTSFSFMQSGGKEYAYFTPNGSPSGRYSYFGMGPALIQQAYSSAAEAINTNKGFLLRDTWITGIFLNTPFVHVRKDPASNIQSNMNGALFGFEQNSGTYIEVQIGSNASSGGGGQYTTVYRFGATSFGSSVVLDETSFPSSPEGFFDGNSSTTQKGLRIVLDSKDWVYVPAGTNMDHIVRFKYNIKAAHSGGTSTSRVLMVLDEKVGPSNGPTYCESKLEGYVTYVQYPVA